MDDMLHSYDRQEQIDYKGEKYLVRDNGAVLRLGRPGGRKRKLDNEWTFGRASDAKGYMYFGSHVVHRIVALAFHEQPSNQHVVDHIDTNRRNNRADNLRWVTRLENILLNEITLARIVHCYGSLDDFFEDPSKANELHPDFSWMRTVTKAEAEESRRRLVEWAESGSVPKGGLLAEWIYGSPGDVGAPVVEAVGDTQSITAAALQRNWWTITEFPACPESVGADSLGEYAARLTPKSVFSRNQFGESFTVRVGGDGAALAVVSRMSEGSVKPWAVAKITVEDTKFVHEAYGTFFTLEGAINAFSVVLGIEPPYRDTFDDYC